MNTNKFLEMMEKRKQEEDARQAASEEMKEDVAMAATEDGPAATMINTRGGGVQIGSSDPQL